MAVKCNADKIVRVNPLPLAHAHAFGLHAFRRHGRLPLMILEALTRPEVHDSVLQSLHRDEAENARAGEERLLLSGVSWERYLELEEAPGYNRPGPRLYYLAGEVEI